MAIRKNVNSLSMAEKTQYVTRVKALKANGTYDQFIQDHDNAMMTPTPPGVDPMTVRNAAHRGPSFFPWHREFILRFERALQQVPPANNNFGLPYWDWAADAALPDPTQAAVWQDDFMGGQGNPVTTGEFRDGQWTIFPSGSLVREFGVNVPTLPTQAQVNAALALTIYDSAPWDTTSNPSFRNQFEGWINGPQLHNRVHVWVGGSMLPGTSPNDPVFFLHHCNVDRLWAQWQLCSSSPDYHPTGEGPVGHNLDDPMFPWNTPADTRRVRDVIDHRALGYSYDTESAFQRTITLRRTTGNRFVSDKILQVVSPCNSQAETDSTLFVPGRVGGVIRAEMGTVSDEVQVTS